MTPSEAFAALQSDTGNFLNRHLLVIAGSPQASGPRDYWLGYKNAGEPGNPESFRIQFFTLGQTGQVKFPAHSVKMFSSKDVLKTPGDFGSIPGYVLSSNTPAIMVTGQLTACTFAIGRTTAGPICTHIQPPANLVPTKEMGIPVTTQARSISGYELNTAILNAGSFAGGTKVAVAFGPRFYPGQNATIIGVCSGANWTIWAQLTNGTTPTGAVQVF